MDLSGKKVAVYGLGVTGLAVLGALQDIALERLIIVNGQRPSETELGQFDFQVIPELYEESAASEALGLVDLILLSPGIPRSKETLTEAHGNGVKIWNEIEWCSQGYHGDTIAITGTNGKTTTVTFLDQAFKAAGVKIFTGGNIGIPLSTIYHSRSEYDLVLLEMSSFQCESLETFKPSIAAYLNLFANHGERYESVEEYRLSKWELTRNQNKDDSIFIGPGAGPVPKFVKGAVQELPTDYLEELNTFIDWQQVKLVGEHNRQNIAFAWKVFSEYFKKNNLSLPIETFTSSLYNFKGVEHRVEACPSFNGHLLYNDAKSTNWQATLSALKAVREKEVPVILIIGGKLRGENDLPEADQQSYIDSETLHILGIGEAVANLKEQWPQLIDVVNLEGIKNWIQSNCSQRVCILFSPAFPSFDQFKNYADRGNQFKEIFT